MDCLVECCASVYYKTDKQIMADLNKSAIDAVFTRLHYDTYHTFIHYLEIKDKCWGAILKNMIGKILITEIKETTDVIIVVVFQFLSWVPLLK